MEVQKSKMSRFNIAPGAEDEARDFHSSLTNCDDALELKIHAKRTPRLKLILRIGSEGADAVLLVKNSVAYNLPKSTAIKKAFPFLLLETLYALSETSIL